MEAGGVTRDFRQNSKYNAVGRILLVNVEIGSPSPSISARRQPVDSSVRTTSSPSVEASILAPLCMPVEPPV